MKANKKIKQNRYKPAPKDLMGKTILATRTRDLGLKVVMTIAVMTVISLGLIYVHDFFMQSPFFNIRQIQITGNTMAPTEALLKLAEIAPEDTLFSVNLFKIEKQLTSHPWVNSVAIRRNLPDTIIIFVTEEEPLAVITTRTRDKILINRQGSPFKEYVASEDANLDLPLVNGLQLERHDAIFGFNRPAFDFVMEILTSPVDITINTISADTHTGISIEVPDRFNTVSNQVEDTIWLKLGFGDYPEKIVRAQKISSYLHRHFAQKRISSMDLFDMETIFVKTEDEDALHNNLKKGA